MSYIAWQQQTHVPERVATWYVADLPGHDGLKRSRSCPNSDWGWTIYRDKAIPLNAYWLKRFVAFCKRDASSRPFGYHEVQDERS